jgi:autoinducer 2-degrading protein
LYVVTVEFIARPQYHNAFLEALVHNARASRETEPGCRQFDVMIDDTEVPSIFLYEVYDDRAAFEAHIRAPHFLEFDAAIRDWVSHKHVRTYSRIDP